MEEGTLKLKRQIRDFLNKHVKDVVTLRKVANVIGLKIKGVNNEQ